MNHLVTKVRLTSKLYPGAKGHKKFAVTVIDVKSKKETTEEYDYVIVGNGHFSVPNKPAFAGIEKFKGRILHTHSYRYPDQEIHGGKRILVIGAGPSALDFMTHLTHEQNIHGVKPK